MPILDILNKLSAIGGVIGSGGYWQPLNPNNIAVTSTAYIATGGEISVTLPVLIGSNIIQIIREIQPLKVTDYNFTSSTGTIGINGNKLLPLETLYIIYSKNVTLQSPSNPPQTVVGLYARIWNNQLKFIREGKDYTWPRPAAFLEIVSPAHYEIIGLGFRSADLGIKIHLIHEFYNQDGTFEQDLTVFDLRDTILGNLSQWCPTACGPLNCINEEQDFDHDNLYHYILEFVCNFIDSKGSPFDPSLNNYDETANPNLDAEIIDGGVPAPVPDPNPEFIIIPQNN